MNSNPPDGIISDFFYNCDTPSTPLRCLSPPRLVFRCCSWTRNSGTCLAWCWRMPGLVRAGSPTRSKVSPRRSKTWLPRECCMKGNTRAFFTAGCTRTQFQDSWFPRVRSAAATETSMFATCRTMGAPETVRCCRVEGLAATKMHRLGLRRGGGRGGGDLQNPKLQSGITDSRTVVGSRGMLWGGRVKSFACEMSAQLRFRSMAC